MLMRRYGDKEEELSILGFGGIMVSKIETAEAEQLVGQGIDCGINYFDVAPSYGNAEEMLGPALQPYREGVFLACKTTERSAAGARRELESSLANMRTDHFDLYQLHAMTTMEDFDQATRPGGALETFVKAREEGKVRYLGFSAHSAECALALLDYFEFDSVLFPINWAHFLNGGFGPQVVEKAEEKGAAVLALKAMAYGKVAEGAERPFAKCWYQPIEEPELQDLALRYALSQPIVAALPPGAENFFARAIEIAQHFVPVTESEVGVLRERAGEPIEMFRLAEAGGFPRIS
jgi:predicted aldo/keto reductase-like oxidoreductase